MCVCVCVGEKACVCVREREREIRVAHAPCRHNRSSVWHECEHLHCTGEASACPPKMVQNTGHARTDESVGPSFYTATRAGETVLCVKSSVGAPFLGRYVP